MRPYGRIFFRGSYWASYSLTRNTAGLRPLSLSVIEKRAKGKRKEMKTKALAIGALCAIAVGFLGCSDANGKKENDTDKAVATTVVGQSDPVAVAKAWWTAATEENADRLLALTAEEARETMKQGIIPHLPEIAKYKGKPIDVEPYEINSTELVKYTEKDGKKYAEVVVVLGGAGTKEANSQTSRLVLKDGNWFVTSKR